MNLGDDNLKIYIGLKEKSKPAMFESETDNGKETHPQYDVPYGPFKSKRRSERYVDAIGELACGED
jgi:hypothetical protein